MHKPIVLIEFTKHTRTQLMRESLMNGMRLDVRSLSHWACAINRSALTTKKCARSVECQLNYTSAWNMIGKPNRQNVIEFTYWWICMRQRTIYSDLYSQWKTDVKRIWDFWLLFSNGHDYDDNAFACTYVSIHSEIDSTHASQCTNGNHKVPNAYDY